MLTRDLQFNICSGVLSCVLLCATYFFYHKIEMKVCFFFEEVYSITIWNFFLTCIKISSNYFSGDFTLLLPVSLKSPSYEPKCKHFYIYNHFVELMKNFPPHTATSAVPHWGLNSSLLCTLKCLRVYHQHLQDGNSLSKHREVWSQKAQSFPPPMCSGNGLAKAGHGCVPQNTGSQVALGF